MKYDTIKKQMTDIVFSQVDYEENHIDAINDYYECLDIDDGSIKDVIIKVNKDCGSTFDHNKLCEYIVKNKNWIDTRYEKRFAMYCQDSFIEGEKTWILIQAAPIGEIEIQFPDDIEKYAKKHHEKLSRDCDFYVSSNGMAYAGNDTVHAWYVCLEDILASEEYQHV